MTNPLKPTSNKNSNAKLTGSQSTSQAGRNQHQTRAVVKESQGLETTGESDDIDNEVETLPQTPQSPVRSPPPGADFETRVDVALANLEHNSNILTLALLGNEKEKVAGVVDRLSKVETDLYSPSGNGQGLVSKVELLEKKIQQQPKPSSGLGSGATPTGLQKQVTQLQATNQVLIGFAAKLQNQNSHLQNELYIQKDRQNILNLLLGGVSYIEGGTCKDEVLAFYHDILKMTSVKEQDIVKAYRKTQPRSYEEEIKKDQTTTKIQVNVPGLMFVRLSTETIRDTTIAKARSLAGQRDATHNFKYFASAMECEAVKATKEKTGTGLRSCSKTMKQKNIKTETPSAFMGHGCSSMVNPFKTKSRHPPMQKLQTT